jgi:hypothetical protein
VSELQRGGKIIGIAEATSEGRREWSEEGRGREGEGEGEGEEGEGEGV